eukprot:9921915-Prorocentrum_lima.AAC.1
MEQPPQYTWRQARARPAEARQEQGGEGKKRGHDSAFVIHPRMRRLNWTSQSCPKNRAQKTRPW